MALFKALRGASSRIDTTTTPFHDGYCYLTVDDGGFYVDVDDQGNEKRIRINPDTSSTYITTTLLASGWSNGSQVLTISGLTSDTNGLIGMADGLTNTQLQAVRDAEMYVSAQGDGTLTVSRLGTTPTCDIPVIVVLN